MLTAFIVLLCAHMTADFLFQSDWMAMGKGKPVPLLSHSFTHFLTSLVSLWDLSLWPVCLFIGVAHTLLDFTKQKIGPAWGPFVADQVLHIASIGAAVWIFGRYGFFEGYEIAPAWYTVQVLLAGVSVTVLGIFYFLLKFSPEVPFDKERTSIEKALRCVLFLFVALSRFSFYFLAGAAVAALLHLWYSSRDRSPSRTFVSVSGSAVTGVLAFWALGSVNHC